MADLSKNLADLDSQLKVKKISAASFKKKTAFDLSKDVANIHGTISSLAGIARKIVVRVGAIEKIVDNQSKKITSLKNIGRTQSKRIGGDIVGEKIPKMESEKDSGAGIKQIATLLDDIINILKNQNKDEKKKQDKERKKSEEDKRKRRQGLLEKGAGAVFKVAEKVLAPVKSLLSRIIDFITAVFLGRALIKLINWFSDDKNKGKVKAIFRFLGDNWPKLLALYLLFGTQFGRFALGLTKSIAQGAVKLLAKIALLAAAKKIKGARGVAKFLGGGKGKLVANVAATGLAMAGTYAMTNMLKGGDDKPNQTKAQGLSGGGYVRPRFPAFGGGGFNFKGMMSGAALGGMFGPLGMLFGAGLGGADNFLSGLVKGPGGPKGDKVPALLSDGEFVMSAGAVNKYGVDTLEAMNTAGGGTNKPKIMSGTTFAAGGGYIGDKKNADTASDASTRENEKKLKEEKKQAASIKGMNIQGGTLGVNIGKGYGALYKGRASVVVKNANITGFEPEINLGGMKYYAMRRGKDIVYVKPDVRDNQSPGMFQPGGMFGGPRTSARMDYATSKGKYYSSSDQKTYRSYKDAFAARKSRLTSLASQQRLDRLSNQIIGRGGRRRETAESIVRYREDAKRGGDFGKIGRFFTSMFGTGAQIAKNTAEDKASEAKVKQAGAVSIGRYYSSSDGKYYKDYATADKARKLRLSSSQRRPGTIAPPTGSKVKVVYTSPGNKGVTKPSGSGGGKQNVPSFNASHPARKSRAQDLYGLG